MSVGRPDRLVAVVGTGTEVGKTWVTARLARELQGRWGWTVLARKPAQSFAPTDPTTDADVLGSATGRPAQEVCPAHRWYEVPMAPPMAAAVLGRTPFTVGDLAGELTWSPPGADAGFLEGAGGVASPLAEDGDNADLLAAVAPDLVLVVADAGLGTINSVRLSVAALDVRVPGVPVLVHLNRYDAADALHRRNRSWLRDRDGFEVTTAPDEAATHIGRLPAGGI